MSWLNSLKSKWGIKSNIQILIILIVFSITGFLAVLIAKPILNLIGVHPDDTSGFLYWPIRIVIIFPSYQILLIIIGSLFGQFKFFWDFEKKMLKRIGFKQFFQEK